MQSFDPGLRSGQPVRSSNVSKSDPGPISVKPSFLKSVSVGLNALANKMMDGATSLMRSSSKMAPETTKGDPKVTSTKEGLKALSEEVSKGEVSFDEFKSKVQDMSDQIDRLDQSGTASKPELKELRVELNRVVKNTMKELKQIVGNPDQSVNDFFETYEAVQHSREFCAAKYMGANDKFTSVSGSFFDGNEAPPTMSDNKSVNREKTQLLREAAYGMVTERSLPVSSNKGGERLLPDQFVALGDQLVDSGMAHRLPDGQLKLNATISNSDIDGFVPDFDSGGLQFVTEGDQKGVVQSVRQSLHELKDHRIVAIALKSNPGSAKVFLPKLDEAAVREKKIELKLHPEYSRATDDQLTEIAEKEVLKESSSLVRTLTEAIEMPHRKGAESAFGDSFSIPKPLESSAKALSKHATLHQAFNVEEGLLRGAHTDILSQRDDLNASSDVIPSFRNLDEAVTFLNDSSNKSVLTSAMRVSNTVHSSKTKQTSLEDKYGVKAKTNREWARKAVFDVGNGVLSPIGSPLKSMMAILDRGAARAASPTSVVDGDNSTENESKSMLRKVTDFSLGVGEGTLEKLGQTLKWVSGPIGGGLEFIDTHKKDGDLSEALGRCWNDVADIGQWGKRVEGRVDHTDFAGLPPLGGQARGRAMSEALYTIFSENGVVSLGQPVDHKQLFTKEFNWDRMESKLSDAFFDYYSGGSVSDKKMKQMSPEEKKSLADAHAKKLFANAKSKLVRVATVKGNLYKAAVAQERLDTLKHTAGWISALGAGAAVAAFPPSIVVIGLVSGGVSMATAATKVVGGMAHVQLAEDRHNDLFRDIPQTTLSALGKEAHAESRAGILSLQDQVLNDFSHGVAMVAAAGTAGAASTISTAVDGGNVSVRDGAANFDPRNASANFEGTQSQSGQASVSEGVAAMKSAHLADEEQQNHSDRGGAGHKGVTKAFKAQSEDSLFNRIDSKSRWKKVLMAMNSEGRTTSIAIDHELSDSTKTTDYVLPGLSQPTSL